MNKKETEIVVSRIEQWYSRMLGYFVEDRTPLSAKYGWSKEAVPFADRNKLKYKIESKKFYPIRGNKYNRNHKKNHSHLLVRKIYRRGYLKKNKRSHIKKKTFLVSTHRRQNHL